MSKTALSARRGLLALVSLGLALVLGGGDARANKKTAAANALVKQILDNAKKLQQQVKKAEKAKAEKKAAFDAAVPSAVTPWNGNSALDGLRISFPAVPMPKAQMRFPPGLDPRAMQDGKSPSGEPSPFLSLKGNPIPVDPDNDPNKVDREKPKFKAELRALRLQQLAERDRGQGPEQASLLAMEKLERMPVRFLVKGAPYRNYAQVANALYGAGAKTSQPVFCAPVRKCKACKTVDGRQVSDWDMSSVECSANWLETLGGWAPWIFGRANVANDDQPPFACIGSPHLFKQHVVLPPGGSDPFSGFSCRKRIFRVLVSTPEKSLADQRDNILKMCSEMRQQTWGEKYPNVNQLYHDWCKRTGKKNCTPKPGTEALVNEPGKLPFVNLSREELLFFYGHTELYCRADRSGLIHFLDQVHHVGSWGKTFTCGVARGVLESGPFEEGVQACAVIPYVADGSNEGLSGDDHKARLHCWKHARPTCEDLSDPKRSDDPFGLFKSNLFDALDTLKEVRRTRAVDLWSVIDLKDAEKVDDWRNRLAYSDAAKDEGVFGVKDFCRFVGKANRLQCGYTKDSIAQYYELHRDETPQGCRGGVCARGAFERGYRCGLFSSRELFEGKVYWMCGIDVGPAGDKLLGQSRAVCVGGKAAEAFQSARGDRGSLQCFERRFVWAESPKSRELAMRVRWSKAVEQASAVSPLYDSWLHGGEQARKGYDALDRIRAQQTALFPGALGAKIAEVTRAPLEAYGNRLLGDQHHALRALLEGARDDRKALLKWVSKVGHTLGHRTSLRLALLGANEVPAIAHLRRLQFKEKKDLSYVPLASGCKGGSCSRYSYQHEPPPPPPPPPLNDIKALPKYIEELRKPRTNPNDMARTKMKAKELMDLVEDVRNGTRAADGKWYQELRIAATEGGQLRIDPAELVIVLRVSHLFEVLEKARAAFLDGARQYADAIHAGARGQALLSRLELAAKARLDPLPADKRGAIFCVPSQGGARTLYACGSSPMLIAGETQRELYARLGGARRRYEEAGTRGRATMENKILSKVRFPWCYGSLKLEPIYGPSPSRALTDANSSSPYYMDVPKSAYWGALPAASVAGQAAAPAKRAPAPKGAMKLSLKGFKMRLGSLSATPSTRALYDWMRCGLFQYSDERWEDADPRLEQKSEGPKSIVAQGAQSDDPRGKKASEDLMNSVGGLMGSLIKFAMSLPPFAKALERVQDLGHAAGEFYDKYVKRFVDLAMNVWGALRKQIEDGDASVVKAGDELAKALDKFHEADKSAAANPTDPNGAKAKEEAKSKLDDAKKALTDAQGALKVLVQKAGETKKIAGTGDLLNGMLDELVSFITQRVMQVVDPNARSLFAQAFSAVRNVLDTLASSILSSLAGVPFVGAALVTVGQIAYVEAMKALQNAAIDALLGVVERLLAKLVRAVVSPIFKVVKDKVLGLAYAACTAAFPRACPKDGKLEFSELPPQDRWLDKSLACSKKPDFEALQREGLAAWHDLQGRLGAMKGKAQAYARGIADRYLARFGYDYDSWLAAAASGSPAAVAQVDAIRAGLAKEAAALKGAAR